MAHPDETRQGSEKGQREHAGRISEASDAGMQGKRQGIQGGADRPADDGTADEIRRSLPPEGEQVVQRDREREASGPATATGTQGGVGTLSEGASGADDRKQGIVSPEVRSDNDGTLPDRGMDRDSGAGAAGGRDTGGTEASRNAQTSRSGGSGR